MGLALIGTIATGLIVAGAAAWFSKWLANKPQRQADTNRARAMQDAILGSGEVRDLGGGIIAESEPGLVARVGDLESAVTTLAEVVSNQKELHELYLGLQREQAMHGVRLTSLERAAEERIEIRRENTALFQAVAERDTINGETE